MTPTFAAAKDDPAWSVALDRHDSAPGDGPPPVLVWFATTDDGRDLAPDDLVRLTAGAAAHRVVVRDVDHCWYQRGLRGRSRDAVATVAVLTGLLDDLGPGRRVFVGSSSGAYAAVLFGVLCGADEVVAFAPAASLTRSGRLRARDRRWRRAVARARRSARHRGHLELVRLLDGRVHRTRIAVHHGEEDRSDARHAERLAGLPGVTVTSHAGGHEVLGWLDDRGEAVPLLEAALRPAP